MLTDAFMNGTLKQMFQFNLKTMIMKTSLKLY